MDCSPFLSWNEEQPETEQEKAVVFRSLVATVQFQTTVDVSLETKAVKFLEYMYPWTRSSADDFLNTFGRNTEASSRNFIQSIGVLLSSASQVIVAAAIVLLEDLIGECSTIVKLALVTADLISQLINTINPHTISLPDCESIHTNLMNIITRSLWLITPDGLTEFEAEDPSEQQTVHETVLKQVLAPLEKYICHLCVNRFSIVDGKQSENFLVLIARLLQICPYHQPTMDFVLHMPVVLTITSYLTIVGNEDTKWLFLIDMNNAQLEWNGQGREVREMEKTVHRMLRMEGIEDVIEEKLQSDQESFYGEELVGMLIEWNNFQGMNLP
ncbi:hypothetical protein BLNAU_17332 [Blattamonas nauphoetae]|uniref:Uncharacterized protein n=1 Tax=Blattamonas nauphoetae TaxID=2049346 RepID=A0ABQ9X928_9EUKA|nr:hypothetical protein BLNAU_17332 [Blattamonas nauphoetae]